MLALCDAEREALLTSGALLPFSITPYYMSLLERDNPLQPLRRTVVPTDSERNRSAGEADDPLGEEHNSPAPGLVHRYPDRVLLLALDYCSSYCRYCTRSRMVGHGCVIPSQERLEHGPGLHPPHARNPRRPPLRRRSAAARATIAWTGF